MNDKNWQLTRNLHVCEKHFPNGDTANGVPDFGAAVIFQNTQQNSSEMLMDTNIETKENIHHQVKSTVSDHIPVNTEDETASANQAERVEEIEVDAADWLPKTVSHQFKEQFIGNDPRYVSVIKDNLMMHIPQQSDQTKSAIEKTIGEDSHTVISEAGTVIFTGGKENVVFKENVKVEGKKFIETETGEMYEILSVEEPHDNMVRKLKSWNLHTQKIRIYYTLKYNKLFNYNLFSILRKYNTLQSLAQIPTSMIIQI